MTNVPLSTTEIAHQLNGERFREVLGSYPTGVAVITAVDGEGHPMGMVVGTFTSVSLDPPLVGYLPMRTSKSFASLRNAETFCVNILASDQEAVCRVFARGDADRFDVVGWRPAPGGAPILNDVVGWLECSYESIVEACDHFFVLGRVQSLNAERDALPLLFFQKGYGRFMPGSFVSTGGADVIEAVRIGETLRPEIESLAAELECECSVLAPMGGYAVYVAESVHGGRRTAPSLGTRVPIAAPLGAGLLGSPGAPTEEEWLSSLAAIDDGLVDRCGHG